MNNAVDLDATLNMPKTNFIALNLALFLSIANIQNANSNEAFATVWPADTNSISAAFGPRLQAGNYDWHRGVDIFGPLETPIFAMADGIAQIYPVGSPQFPSGGNVVVITHPNIQGPLGGSVYSIYLHMNSFNIQDDEEVTAGQDIGGMGSTGNTEFIHLHFEVREDNRSSLESQINNMQCPNIEDCKDPHVNPLKYIANDDGNGPAIEVISEAPNPLTVRFTVSSTELDLNRFVLRSLGNEPVIIDYNTREGFDATSTANLDQDPTPSGPNINPPTFTSQSFIDNENFVVEIEFPNTDTYTSIHATDTFGNETVLTSPEDDFLLLFLPAWIIKK